MPPETTRHDDAGAGAYWSVDVPALLHSLGSGEAGLRSSDAEARLARCGPNALAEAAGASPTRLFFRQFGSPLVLILVFGAAVSLALRDWIDATIILAIVVASAVLGFVQEHRAETALVALRRRLAITVRARRDGELRVVPAATIVPGDVVELAAGNLVPADGRVLAARDFLVNEANLTGESFPVEKSPGCVDAGAALAARSNCVFMGTSVRSGTATVLVVATGARAACGAIAAGITARDDDTDFARGLRAFGHLLLQLMVLMVLFVVVVNHLLGRPAIESLLFAIALAVGLSPELLPAIVSVTLARGARSMAARGVIVRRLEAIENLGGIDVFCTDKTGTLTSGRIELAAAVDPDGVAAAEVLRLAYVNAALETGIDNPLDAAIVAAGERAGFAAGPARKIDEIPYDFERRRLTVVVAPPGVDGHLLVTKGAYASVLAQCTGVRSAGSVQPLDGDWRMRLDHYHDTRGRDGVRVLAVASRVLPARDGYTRADETGLTLDGFLEFLDPPKPGVAAAIADLAALGIRIKVITGDSRHVAVHLAHTLGLAAPAVLTGEDLARMKPEALWHRATRTDLFVEVDPQQKEHVIRALQHAGHVVGYLGDGINDAPALHAADVGISVEGATDVARASADVVLTSPDLEVLRDGVEHGRRSFANTLKYITITTSANFGNMVSMAIATPLLPFLPLAAKQILLNNLLSDLPSIAISTDRVDRERTCRAQHWDMADLRRFMLVFGLLSTVFDLVTFWLLLRLFETPEATFQTAWFVVSLLTELAVLLVLRSSLPLHRSRPGALLGGATAVVAVAALALPFCGPVARVFGFVALDAPLVATLVGIVVLYAAATEFAKRRYRHPRTHRAGRHRPGR